MQQTIVNYSNMRAVRELLHLSQTELAHELGWSTGQQVSNIECGLRPLSRQTELALECLVRRALCVCNLKNVD